MIKPIRHSRHASRFIGIFLLAFLIPRSGEVGAQQKDSGDLIDNPLRRGIA